MIIVTLVLAALVLLVAGDTDASSHEP